MKCDKLKAYKGDVTIPVYGTIADADVYLKKDVDAAIAELKDKVKFCSDFELAARKDIEEMRGQHQMLKQFGHYKLSPVPGKMINHDVRQYVSYNVVCMIINHLESENTQLKQKLAEKESWVKMLGEGEAALSLELEKTKQKLEDVQASMYADVVDANMENRKLRRALWIARANRAEAEHAHWATIWFCNNKIVLNINKSSVSQDPYKSNTLKYAYEWRNMWFYIASKCRTKAEEYK